MKRKEPEKIELKEKSARHDLERTLGAPLQEENWQYLQNHFYIEQYLQGEKNFRQLVNDVRELQRSWGHKTSRGNHPPRMLSAQNTKSPKGRSNVVSFLAAKEAAKDAEVQAFRTVILDGKLISMEEVKEWIQLQASKDGLHTWWLTNIPVSREYMVKEIMQGTTSPPPPFQLKIPSKQVIEDCEIRFLRYGEPSGEEWRVPTYYQGILERLRQLSEHLAQEYGWTEAEATLFVLTGAIPEISSIRDYAHYRRLPILSRLVLVVDPTMSPREVADYYRQIRQRAVGARYRNLGEKHMELALFTISHQEEETWLDKMAEWNRTHPAKWKYEQVAYFRRDCLQAQKRLWHSQ